MFSPDGRQLVFASTRGPRFGKDPRAARGFTVFLAKWVP